MASRALSSSHTFMLRRSIGSTPGSADLTAGISGPLYTFVAEVEATTGRPNTVAVFASATTLFMRTCRSIEPTPKASPACWSTRSRAQSLGSSRRRGFGAIDFLRLGLQECEEVSVDLVRMRRRGRVRSARVDLQLGTLDHLGGELARIGEWHDLVVLAVDHQSGHVDFGHVGSEVCFRERAQAIDSRLDHPCLDAVEHRLHDPLMFPGLDKERRNRTHKDDLGHPRRSVARYVARD